MTPALTRSSLCSPGDSNENKPAVGAEDEEVAKMGCPSLGEHTQVEVVIEESYEFKVSVRTPEQIQDPSAASRVHLKSR